MSENKMNDSLMNEMESFEMLKALYDFKAVYAKTISFDEGEYFILHQTSARQRNWWQVVSMKGNIGFVPSNYVMKLKVEPNFLNCFLESSIESLKLSTDKEINGIINRDELIERLIEKKIQIEKMLQESEENELNHKQIGNGYVVSLDHYNDDSSSNPENDVVETKRTKAHHSHKHEFTKKSMSSPAVSAAVPQFVQESPSMSVISPKQTEELSAPSVQDSSAVSETSEAETTNTATTTTTTTTSDDITAISKIEEDIKTETIVELDDNLPDFEIESITEDDLIVHLKDSGEPEEEIIVKLIVEENNNVEVVEEAPAADPVNKVQVQDVYQIVDAIRANTSLSYDLSCVALRVVLSELEVLLPSSVVKHLDPIAVHLTNPLEVAEDFLGQTHDAQRLRIIFSEMADYKNDSEQRTWLLHEDEADIQKFLIELIRILTDADPKISRTEMSCDHYQSIINLVLYYQMETRWSIRMLLLKVFRAMCHLDYTAVDILLGSVLPLELVQDIMSNPKQVEKLQELASMLILIFSLGLQMPTNHKEHFRSEFIIFVLDIIERPPETDVQEVLPDIMLNLILSFNLQFDNFTENIVLEAMEQLKTSKTFTEKILLLINREEDPVHTLKHTPAYVNPVLKMLVDLFSTAETASIFYTNDNKVLIDILVRQLSDLSAGEPIRKWYLELCRKILRNTNYPEHTHRKQDLMKIFTRIFCEETECSANDQQIVREISNEFPQIFKA